MTTDLGRVAIAVTVGMLLPLALMPSGRRALAVTVTTSIAAWGCGPVLDRWEGWAITACAFASVLLATRPTGARGQAMRAVLGLGFVLLIAIVLLDWDGGSDAVGRSLSDDGAVVVVCGALLAVFVGGIAIGAALRPLARELEGDDRERQTRIHAGLYIGWLERALLYGFIVAGAPGAAAVVVAAKSIARFPSFKDQRFAEYYLVGTLSSVIVAAASAVAARAILGLGPLVS